MAQPGLLPLDPDLLPTLNTAAPEQHQHGPITSGVVRGVLDVLGGSAGAAIAGAGKLFGSPGIENAGVGIQNYTQSAAPTFNRPDLEVAPWQTGGAHVLPWLEYQAAKQVPLMAAYMAGGRGLAKAGIEAPAALQSVAARVPKVLGGGGLRASMGEAEQLAARQAGKGFAQTALGAEVVGTPLAFGQMYQEAQNQPGGATHADAVKALGLSPFYAALDATEPAEIGGLLKRGLAGGVVKRAVTAGLVGSASEVVQEGVQTAMEQSFRSDLTPQQKLSNVVTAALTGGAIGGVFGGGSAALGGRQSEQTLRAVKDAPAADLQTNDIKGIVDHVLGLPPPAVYTDAAGRSAMGSNADETLRATPRDVGMSPTDRMLADATIPQAPPAIESQTIIQPKQGSLRWAQDYEQAKDDLSRPFRGLTDPELQSAQNALLNKTNLSPEHSQILNLVDAELQFRNNSERVRNVNEPTVEAVEPNLSGFGGAASNSGAPASTNSNIADLLKGITTRSAYAGAKTIDEVADIARERYNRKSVAQGDLALVDRLKQAGVDLDAASPVEAQEPRVSDPTGAAATLATTTTPTTTAPAAPANQEGGDRPVDAEFQAKWQNALHGLHGASVSALREMSPANAKEALRAVYDTLGGKGPQEQGARDGIETLGQRLGLLGSDLSLTPLGHKVGRAAIPTEEAVQGAIEQGFSGNAAAFERGARASSIDKTPTFKSVEEAKAYMAGHEWAIPKVASAEATETATGKLRGNPSTLATKINISGDQQRQQVLNKVIDSLGVSTSLKPGDIAQLKQMVRDGAPSRQVIDAVQQVREGKSLFEQPAAKPSEPFKGEVVTPSQYVRARQQREAAQRGAAAQFELSRPGRKAGDQQLIQQHQRLQMIRAAAARIQEQKEADEAREAELEGRELKGDARDILRYRRGGNGVASARADIIREHVADLTKNWKSGLKVNVVETLSQLPSDIRTSIEKDGASDAYGFVRDGQVYLMAQNMPNIETATAALYHEALGHMGLQSLFRDKMDDALGLMYRTNASLRKEVDAWREANAGYYRKDDIALAVEEVLAQRSEAGQLQPGWLSKIAAIIKSFARRMGLKLNFSDNEINTILSLAHDQIVNGKPESATDKGLRYMMALWHGSPHDFDQFSLSKIGTGEGAQVYGHGLYFASMKGVAENYRDALSYIDKVTIDGKDPLDWVIENVPADVDFDLDELEAMARTSRGMSQGSTGWQLLRNDFDREWMDARHEGNKDGERYWRAAIDLLDKMHDVGPVAHSKGKIYHVNVKALDEQFMDWFKSYSEQSQYVKDALHRAGIGEYAATTDIAGADIYHRLRFNYGTAAAASRVLLDAGIRGNKYRDQFSRNQGNGTYNYVVFDDGDIEIANKYMRPSALNDSSKSTIGNVVEAAERQVNQDGLRGKVRRGALGWAGEKAVEEHYGPWFQIAEGNGVVERRAAMSSKHAMSARMSQPVTDLKDRIDQLKRTHAKSYDAINRLTQLTEFGLNPLRSWDKQAEEVRDNANADNLKAMLANSVPLVRSLQSLGHLQIYHDMRALNDISILAPKATGLHLDVTADKVTGNQIEAFKMAPMDEFMDKAASQEMDIQGTRNFWRQAILDRVNALDTFLADQKQKADNMKKGREKSELVNHIDTLEGGARELSALLKRLEDVPYFHLGRDGDYFVDMKLRKLPNGEVDPAALSAAAEHLAEFGKVVSSESSQDHIYIRVKDEVAQRNLLKAAEELQQKGVVRKNQPDAQTGKVEYAIQSGKRDDARVRNTFAPRWLNSFIQRVNGDESIAAADKKRLIEEARSAALDIMPDNSLAKVMTQRRAVPGFDPKMFDSFFDRQKIGIDAHVGMAVAPKITEAFGKMRLAVDRAQGAPLTQVDINQKNGMTEIVDELSRRDAERPNIERTPVIDAVRQASNTWALGLSPAFVAMQVVQIPQLVYPRLGAQYGFVKAAKAMSGSTTQALAIMRQVFKDGFNVSAARSFDAVISLGSLQRAGVGKSTAEYLMHLANTGQLDIGGPNRELTRAVDGSEESPLHKVQRFASAPGYYAETFSRVLTALAHYKLNSELNPYDAAQKAAPFIEDTLWNYAQDMQGRMFGKRGVFGSYTPLATQFMTYASQLVQRLYLDMHAAMFANDPKAKAEARKFLMGHLAATTVFAGTLGLPFATLFAAAFDRLKDLGDDDGEPSNIQAAYRNWLADMFGKDVGEMIAKGATRALGVDISQRVGEQDLAPFSKFIADRRALKDRLKDLEARSWGAPASLASQALAGGSRVMDGDVIGGMAQMLPVGLGSLVKSYQMTDKGYVDSNGKQLPIETPSTTAILAQAIGFTPSQKAEYNEARGDVSVRKGALTRDASNLRKQLTDAIIDGDQESMRSLFGKAQQFDAANPAFAVLPSIEGSIRQRTRQRALAAATRSPLGVNVKDIAGQQLTNYAHIDYAQQ
jgi:hypothetical protein